MFLNVAIDKNVTAPNTTNEDKRIDYFAFIIDLKRLITYSIILLFILDEHINKQTNRKKEKQRSKRHTQRERGVPSSANWKPTNPFKRRHQKVAEISPR
jgi:hypothetical protein